MNFDKFEFEIPIINTVVCVGGVEQLDQESFVDSMEDLGQRVYAHTWIKDGVIYMAYSDIMTQDILAHEIVHIVSFAFRERGIKYDVDNDEFQGYLTGWLFKVLNEHIFKPKKHSAIEDVQPFVPDKLIM